MCTAPLAGRHSISEYRAAHRGQVVVLKEVLRAFDRTPRSNTHQRLDRALP